MLKGKAEPHKCSHFEVEICQKSKMITHFANGLKIIYYIELH